MLKSLLIFLTLILGSASGNTVADRDEMQVPVDLQFNIFVKVLKFDRSLQDRNGGEIVLGVLYHPRVRESSLAKDELIDAVHTTGASIQGRSIRTVPIVAATSDELDAAIREHGIDLLYVGPIRAFDVSRFTAVTRARSVTTLTGVPRHVEEGLSIGIGLVGDRPEIIINVEAAKAEGAQLQARLLKLARIVDS